MTLFSKWIAHPSYFLFWFTVGLIAWSLSFDEKKLQTPRLISSQTQAQAVQMFQLSSIAEDVSEIHQTEYETLSRLTDNELLSEIEKNKSRWSYAGQADYAKSPQEIENLEFKNQKNLPHRFKDNPVFKIIQQLQEISEESALITPEDSSSCNTNQLFYEKQILGSTKIKDLLLDRPATEAQFSKKCITHIMNRYSVPNNNYGVCAKAAGYVRTPGAKPCISRNLVNLTYSSYMDVVQCLNLDPKLLMPKIDNESGFVINTFGEGKDGGIGQLTRSAIAEVNNYYEQYLLQMKKAAATKPSCARVISHKDLIVKAADSLEQRCALIGVPENPIRNILYMALLNRINMDKLSGIKYLAGGDYLLTSEGKHVAVKNDATDEMGGAFKNLQIKNKLEALGIKNINMHFFKEIIGFAGYNMGVQRALKLFNEYLDKRKASNLPLTVDEFDFNNPKMIIDESGDERSVVSMARAYVMSSFIGPNDTPELKAIKVKRRKELPKQWALAYTKTFPEFLALKANSYDGKTLKPYDVYGFPGYLNSLANRNKSLRMIFENSKLDPNMCSNPDFFQIN